MVIETKKNHQTDYTERTRKARKMQAQWECFLFRFIIESITEHWVKKSSTFVWFVLYLRPCFQLEIEDDWKWKKNAKGKNEIEIETTSQAFKATHALTRMEEKNHIDKYFI